MIPQEKADELAIDLETKARGDEGFVELADALAFANSVQDDYLFVLEPVSGTITAKPTGGIVQRTRSDKVQ